MVILFKNAELVGLLDKQPSNTQEIYTKTVAEKFHLEKQRVVKELNQFGIYTVFTDPEDLTVNTINKYLELKSRGVV